MKSKFFIFNIIFGIFVLPGMMFLFPLAEWIQWHPGYVLGYILWLYAVWALCLRVLGPLSLQGWRGIFTVAGSLFTVGIITFLMSLTQVDIPQDPTRIGTLQPHIRAMWILLLAVVSYGVPVGALTKQLRTLQQDREEILAADQASVALEALRAQVDTGEEIQVKAGYKIIHLPLSAIQYIEGRNNYACFHLDHRDDVVSQITLKKTMELLPEGAFVRIHRSYIVPLWRIEKRSATAVKLIGMEESLPVGRAHKDNLANNG